MDNPETMVTLGIKHNDKNKTNETHELKCKTEQNVILFEFPPNRDRDHAPISRCQSVFYFKSNSDQNMIYKCPAQ